MNGEGVDRIYRIVGRLFLDSQMIIEDLNRKVDGLQRTIDEYAKGKGHRKKT